MRVFAPLTLLILTAGCSPARPAACPDRSDDQETDAELAGAAGKDACDRAGARLAALKCPEARPDFGAFCRNALANHVPICPVKLSRITKCAQVDGVCR